MMDDRRYLTGVLFELLEWGDRRWGAMDNWPEGWLLDGLNTLGLALDFDEDDVGAPDD